MDAAFAWADEADQVAEASRFALLPDGSFPVWTENVPSIIFFLSVARCWRHRQLGRISKVVGMNWTEIHSKMVMKGFDAPRQAVELARLELIEEAVMEAIA